MTRRQWAGVCLIAVMSLPASTWAEGLGWAGLETGTAMRSTDRLYPDPQWPAFAMGVHVELSAGPLFKIGPYDRHYEIPHDLDHRGPPEGNGWFGGGTFNAFGVRTRFIPPVPGSFQPYAFV